MSWAACRYGLANATLWNVAKNAVSNLAIDNTPAILIMDGWCVIRSNVLVVRSLPILSPLTPVHQFIQREVKLDDIEALNAKNTKLRT